MRHIAFSCLVFCVVLAVGCDEEPASDCPANTADADQDGICDDVDNCVGAPNPMQIDLDGDGVGNACDPTDDSACAQSGGDADEDGVCLAFDNCVATPNPDQLDSDGDGIGDECDTAVDDSVCSGKGGDADDDMVCQAFDNCPDDANPDQRDQDADGFGDECDATPLPCDDLGGDTDGDTVCDDVDNCPDDSNLNQLDIDHDNIGDVCDPAVPPTAVCNDLGGDLDDDSWCGVHDNCPNDPNPQQLDSDIDGIGDACDVETCDGVDNDGDGQLDNGFPDTDSDGAADCVDACPLGPETDTDSDGIPDCIDPCVLDHENDADGDGICMPGDNCPADANPTQSDKDGDGIGDHCDVEECDGISNDVDSSIDEGMPDTDGDGTCDDIDPCPDHVLDDIDNDGLCGDIDNCPSVANDTQTDSDSDSIGDACDIDSASACGAIATLYAAGTVPVPSDLQFNQLVVDPTGAVIYGTLGSDPDNAAYGNRVMAIDAETSSILWSTNVGSEPNPVAISDDGTILYVGLDGAGRVRMVNVPQRRACVAFPLPMHPIYLSKAVDIEVLPGSPETIVTTTSRQFSSFSHGTAVFDHGDKRLLQTDGNDNKLVLADASTAYSSGFGPRLTGLAITSDGITVQWEDSSVIGTTSADLVHADGLLYASSGNIVDPTGPTLVATLAASGRIAVDTGVREAYIAFSSSIDVFDIDTYAWKRTISLASPYTAHELVMWGDDGLAVLQIGQLTILDGVRGP